VEIPNYVMVPVPEQMVPRVMEHILWLTARDAISKWDKETFEPVFHGSSETTKAVLSLTARRNAVEKEITVDMVADLLGITAGQVFESIRAINQEAFDLRKPAVCSTRTVEDTLANGRKARKHLLEMQDNLVDMVQQAEAAERGEVQGSPVEG